MNFLHADSGSDSSSLSSHSSPVSLPSRLLTSQHCCYLFLSKQQPEFHGAVLIRTTIHSGDQHHNLGILRYYIYISSPRGATSAYHRISISAPLRLIQPANLTYCYLFGFRFRSDTASHRRCLANAATNAHRPRRANKATETSSCRHCISQSPTRIDWHITCLPSNPSRLLPTTRTRSSRALGQPSWRSVATPPLIVSYVHIFQSRTSQGHYTDGTDSSWREFRLDLSRAMEFPSSIGRISRIWFAGART